MRIELPPRLTGVLGRILQWLAVTAGIFVWWMALLLVISLFTVNVWHVTFWEILWWSVGLTAVSGAVYLGVMIRRSRRG
jgi:hypothetical protein